MQTTFTIFLRPDQKNLDGRHSVCLRVVKNRKHKLYSLRIYVSKKDWSFRKNHVLSTDDEHLSKNKRIEKFKFRAQKIIADYFLTDKHLTFSEFKTHLFSDSYGSNSFYGFIQEQLDKSSNLLSNSTSAAYKSQLKKLKEFKSELYFHEIDYSLLESYEKTLLKSNNRNTVNKSLTFIKTFLNRSINLKVYKGENPFANFTISKVNGTRDYLNSYELEKLEDLLKSDKLRPNKENVLRYFLFCCYTGLRFSDITNVKFSNIQSEYRKENGEKIQSDILDITMHKTKKSVRIPLIKHAKDLIIYPKHYSAEKKIFNVMTSQPTNRYLKELVSEVGIDKAVSFHVARHTFATNAVNYGLSTEVISKILGHSDLKTTEIYVKISDSFKIKEMQKMENQMQV